MQDMLDKIKQIEKKYLELGHIETTFLIIPTN